MSNEFLDETSKLLKKYGYSMYCEETDKDEFKINYYVLDIPSDIYYYKFIIYPNDTIYDCKKVLLYIIEQLELGKMFNENDIIIYKDNKFILNSINEKNILNIIMK